MRPISCLACLVAAASVLGGEASAQFCPEGNLAASAKVSGYGLEGEPAQIGADRLVPEGTLWDAPPAVVFASAGSAVRMDLSSVRELRALLVQADNNDTYVVDGSVDGKSWRTLWRAPPVEGAGLRTRVRELSSVEKARFLRVRGMGGDGAYSLAALHAYCQAPDPWPVVSPAPAVKKPWLDGLTQERVDAIKMALAALGLVVALWGLALRRAGRPDFDRRGRDRALLALGLLAAAGWWNFFGFHFPKYEHVWEHYHYYMGSKYVRELGYTRLYECSVVADLEAGLRSDVLGRRIRNLETNRIESTAQIVTHPERCKGHFTEARWRSFVHDASWFRGQMGGPRWASAQRDHGYNGTPAWGIAGTLLSNLAPASDASIRALALIDPVLLAVMWWFVYRTFGWRAMCVAMLWWGTNYPARYWWIGGSPLRQDWLVLSVIGICLARRERMAAAGAVLTWAALLRIFPALIVGGLVLKVLALAYRNRSLRLEPAHREFAAGALASLVLCGLVSSAVAGGASVWGDFARNSRTHLSTPLTNNMGLPVVLAYQDESRAEIAQNPLLDDPYSGWKAARQQLLSERRVLQIGVVLAFVVLLARVARGQPDWVALVLGVGLIPFATEITCYYYSILLAYGLLWPRRPEIACSLLCALALLTYLASYASGWYDVIFAFISLATLVTVVAFTLLVGRVDGVDGVDGPALSGKSPR